MLAHQRRHILGGIARALGQLAHLVGQAPAGRARPRRLDGGVQGQQVGLVCHRLDGADNGANTLQAFFQLLTLLAARTELALEAGDAKAALGRAVQDPEREAALLARVAARGAGALTPEDLVELWTLLMAATRRAESQR